MSYSDERRQAIEIARRRLKRRPVYLDTETTGLGPAAEIVEIAIIDHDGSVLLDELVRPTTSIPPDAVAIHGITDQMVRDSQAWPELWPEVEDILRGKDLAIYNADFDVRMMQQTHQRHWLTWRMPAQDLFCIMQLYARYFGKWDSLRQSFRWQSLQNAGKQSGLALANTHRAKDDAALARAVLHHIAAKAA
jgi:DNA polymerase-3 subunit epsilon